MLLRKKIAITMLALVSIPLIVLSIMIYTYISKEMIQINQNRIKSIAQTESQNLYNIINAYTDQLELIVKTGEVRHFLLQERKEYFYNHDNPFKREVEKILSEFVQNIEERDNIFIANLNGELLLSSRSEALYSNIKSKSYFNNALMGETTISNIEPSYLQGEKVIIMTTPIRDYNDEVVGVLGQTLRLEVFKNRIRHIKMDHGGYIYIVDAEGIIIAHPDEERLGTPVQNTTINDIIKQIKNQQVVLAAEGTYRYQGQDKYMAYGIIPDINWLIIFAQDIKEMNEPVRIALILIIATTIACIVVALISSLEFSRSITQPIEKLIKTMEQAQNGDLSVQCDYKSKNEFGQLAKHFNDTLSRLSLSYNELSAVYQQLTAAEEELRAQYDELQTNEEYLRKSEEKYKLALEGSNDIIWEWDQESKVFSVPEKWKQLMGDLLAEKPSLKDFFRCIHKEDLAHVIRDLKLHLEGQIPFYKSEFRIQLNQDEEKWLLIRGKALKNLEGKVIKIAGSMTDITDRKMIQKEVEYMAYHDPLTKLPNRYLFMKHLEQELQQAKEKAYIGAIMLIDLDNFKNINDTLGHEHGDSLLTLIAKKLNETATKQNMVCRFGGDEFLVLCTQANNIHEIVDFARRILDIFKNPFLIEGKPTYITASIGISTYPKDGEISNILLKNADVAMYRAKLQGKNSFLFFDDNMQKSLERKIKIELLLRQALQEESFEIYYQPQIDIKDNKIIGLEALLRLNTQEMGFISPAEFIPIAEECGLIKELGLWCLRQVCVQNKRWQDSGYLFKSIGVNISTVQFEQKDFVDLIVKVLEETQLEPQYLEIEITETVLMKSLEKNIETLKKLKELGIKIALDDFGTGYSSFNYLRKLPLDTLKIDKSFIDGIAIDSKEKSIAYGIIQLAHQMELTVVAEGVEGQEQLEILQKQSCDKAQGYLFSKPVPATQIEVLLK